MSGSSSIMPIHITRDYQDRYKFILFYRDQGGVQRGFHYAAHGDYIPVLTRLNNLLQSDKVRVDYTEPKSAIGKLAQKFVIRCGSYQVEISDLRTIEPGKLVRVLDDLDAAIQKDRVLEQGQLSAAAPRSRSLLEILKDLIGGSPGQNFGVRLAPGNGYTRAADAVHINPGFMQGLNSVEKKIFEKFLWEASVNGPNSQEMKSESWLARDEGISCPVFKSIPNADRFVALCEAEFARQHPEQQVAGVLKQCLQGVKAAEIEREQRQLAAQRQALKIEITPDHMQALLSKLMSSQYYICDYGKTHCSNGEQRFACNLSSLGFSDSDVQALEKFFRQIDIQQAKKRQPGLGLVLDKTNKLLVLPIGPQSGSSYSDFQQQGNNQALQGVLSKVTEVSRGLSSKIEYVHQSSSAGPRPGVTALLGPHAPSKRSEGSPWNPFAPNA